MENVTEVNEGPEPNENVTQSKENSRQPEKESRISSDDLHLEKIDNLNKALKSERSNLAKIKAERDQLEISVNAYTIKEKKSDALNAAISGLGDDFEIPTEKLTALNKIINKIQDSESLTDDIAEAVALVKTSKVKEEPKVINAPFSGPAQNQANTKDRTPEQWMQLAISNPDQFRKEHGGKY